VSSPAAPLVVVSVVSWNTAALTLRCLDALAASSYPAQRVVVVDNASQDDTLERLRAAHPEATVIAAGSNLGFAAGHALAWQRARQWAAAAIWLVNSDAEPEPGALGALVDAWRSGGDALYGGAPLRRLADGTVELNFPAKYLAPHGRPQAFARDRPLVFDATWQNCPPCRVGAAAGSCLLVPLALAERHGWLDPAWFLYCEEIDYAYRLRAVGVPAVLVPAARVWHAGGGSHRRDARAEDAVAYYRARNEIVLAARHRGPATAAVIASKKLLRAAASALSRPRQGLAIARGTFDALRGRMGKVVAPEGSP
jgi:GT2 family glycosyltransferase